MEEEKKKASEILNLSPLAIVKHSAFGGDA